MIGMQYTDTSGDRMAEGRAVADPSVVIQQKMDGVRVLIDLSTGETTTHRGTPVKFAAARQHLGAVIRELTSAGMIRPRSTTVLDGELIVGTGVYHVFDVVDRHRLDEPLYRRLTDLMKVPVSEHVQIVQTFSGAYKGPAVAAMWEAGVEGYVVKSLQGAYEPGKRVKHVTKMKFIKTADVIVTGRTAAPNACTFAVYGEDGLLVEVGACSMIGKPDVVPGDVIEVAYLFWTGMSLYQPRMMCRRDDKAANAADCSIQQMPEYSRAVVPVDALRLDL